MFKYFRVLIEDHFGNYEPFVGLLKVVFSFALPFSIIMFVFNLINQIYIEAIYSILTGIIACIGLAFISTFYDYEDDDDYIE